MKIYLTVCPVGPRKSRLADQWFVLIATTDLGPVFPTFNDRLIVQDTAGTAWPTVTIDATPRTPSPADKPQADGLRRLFSDPIQPLTNEHQAYLATVPGSLAQEFGLVRYFKLVPPAAGAPAKPKLLIAPEQLVAAGPPPTSSVLTGKSTTPVPQPPGSPDRYEWTYADGTVVVLTSTEIRLTPTVRTASEADADDTLDLDTYWLKLPSVSATSILAWVTSLVGDDVAGLLQEFQDTSEFSGGSVDNTVAFAPTVLSACDDGERRTLTQECRDYLIPYSAPAGTVTVTNGSDAIAFATPQALSKVAVMEFSSQPGVRYSLSAPIAASTAGTLTTAYTGATSSTATVDLKFPVTPPSGLAVDQLNKWQEGWRNFAVRQVEQLLEAAFDPFAASLGKLATRKPIPIATHVLGAKPPPHTVAGLGLVLRVAGGTWRCATAARIGVPVPGAIDTPATNLYPPSANGPSSALVPLRFPYRNDGSRRRDYDGVVAYDNASLVARGIMSDAVQRAGVAKGQPLLVGKIGTPPAPTTATVTSGSNAITFGSPQTLAAGTLMVFSRQPDVSYELKASVGGATAGTLTTNYNGETSAAATFSVLSSFVYEPVLATRPTPGTPSVPDRETYRLLTPLRFGNTYEIAVFIMDLGLGVPDALRSIPGGPSDRPWLPGGVEPVPPPVPPHVTAPNVVRRSVTYRRTVPVGQIRVTPSGDTPLPQAPSDMRPMSSDILSLGAPALSTDRPPPAPHRMGPVLLQHSGFPSTEIPGGLALDLRPPTVDMDVIERSTSDWDRLRAAQEWYVRNGLKSQTSPDSASFDDPLFGGYVVALEKWDWGTATWTPIPFGADPYLFLSPGTEDAVVPFRSGPVTLTIGTDMADGTRPQVVLPTPARNVDAGLVYRFTIYGAILDAGASSVFPVPQLAGPVGTPFVCPPKVMPGWAAAFRASKQMLLLAPVELVVELPSAVMPTQDDLITSLGVATADRTATLSLGFSHLMYNVGRLELVRQAWRWCGHPLTLDGVQPTIAPRPKDPPGAPDLSDAFDDLDARIDVTVRSLGYLHIPTVVGAVVELAKDPVGGSLAELVRYRLRAYSRYALDGEFVAPIEADKPSQSEAWRTVLFPYIGKEPSAPLVHAIVPLTQPLTLSSDSGEASKPTAGTARTVTPLLIALAEPAFAQAGITEFLEAKVFVDPTSNVSQFGTDPTISPGGARGVPGFVVRGPFGFTRDPDDAPLPFLRASSYTIECDDTVAVDPWSFARIQLRRRSVSDASDERSSRWTPPTWVQFPPASSFSISTSSPLSDDRKIITVVDPARLSSSATRRFYAVLTQPIRRASGADDELFLGYVEKNSESLGPDGLVLTFDLSWLDEMTHPFIGGAQATIYARILEVQGTFLDGPPVEIPRAYYSARSGDSPRKPLWNLLMSEDGKDVSWRVVRVSNRLDFGD